MKLKNILAAAIMVAATVGITSSVYAATAVRIGEVENKTYTTADTLSVPVIIETTDESVNNIGAYDITVSFDKASLKYKRVDNNLVATDEDGDMFLSGSLQSTPTADANANGAVILSYATATPTKLSDAPNATFTLLFKPLTDYTFDPSDIQIKLDEMASTTNTTGATNTKIYADSFNTYVSFDVPDTYDKYIHKVYLQLNGTDYELKNCQKVDGGYRFVVSINNTGTAKKSAAAKVILGVADTADAGATISKVEYKDLGTIVVENV